MLQDVCQAQIHKRPLWNVARVLELLVVPLGFDNWGIARVAHLGRSTCHAISGRGDQSTRIPDG